METGAAACVRPGWWLRVPALRGGFEEPAHLFREGKSQAVGELIMTNSCLVSVAEVPSSKVLWIQ